MEIGERKQGNVVVLCPVGRIDNDTSPGFQSKLLAAATPGGCAVLVDLSRVEYVSSAGLRALMMGAKQAKVSKGRLAVAELKPVVKESSRSAASPMSWRSSEPRPRRSRPSPRRGVRARGDGNADSVLGNPRLVASTARKPGGPRQDSLSTHRRTRPAAGRSRGDRRLHRARTPFLGRRHLRRQHELRRDRGCRRRVRDLRSRDGRARIRQ